MRLSDLSKNLHYLSSIAENPLEDWDRIVYSGPNNGGLLTIFSDVLSLFFEVGQTDKVTLDLDGDSVDVDEINEIKRSGGQFETWRLLINKNGLVGESGQDESQKTIYFLDKEKFIDWAKKISPFDGASPFRSAKSIKILVEGLESAFGGPSLAITSFDGVGIPDIWPLPIHLPGEEEIKAQVHVGSSESIFFSPRPFLLSWGDLTCEESEPFRALCWKLLTACLVQDFFGINRVVLRGVRRLELPLCLEEEDAPSEALLRNLFLAFTWVYEERVETRAKLLAERLSLDLEAGCSLASQLPLVLDGAIAQAREQYGFVILERKDEYVRELRTLLKDVKSQADLYADKTRRLLGGLLRDSLGALLLVTVTMLARVSQKVEFISSTSASILFKALSVYFLTSIVLQMYVHLTDLRLSNNEVNYWSEATRNYMPVSEQKKHLHDAIKSRKESFRNAAILFAILYLILAGVAFFFPHFFALIFPARGEA